MIRRFLAGLVIAATAYAAEIVLPSMALERDGPVHCVYRTQRGTGKGTLALRWTDVYGRVVEERSLPVELTDESEIGFDLDLRRAVAMQNELAAHLSFAGQNRRNQPDQREEDATMSFIARPAGGPWSDYAIIMWQNYPADQFATLKSMGINGGQYVGRNNRPPEFLLKNDLRWYVENIATDFYSSYHRWFPDRPVNWLFAEAKQLYQKDPVNSQAFKRLPSLSDETWLRTIHNRLVDTAKRWSPYRPFFYSLGDETGIADLAAYWDFDFSDQSLAAMRVWLQQRYGSLAALNREWGTTFASWELVTPSTTDEAVKRTDDNYASWADFKDWMDEAYARALRMGTDAVRSVDPDAYVGIGGGQMPGWGGYDYERIARSLTAIEPYDIGSNIEILRSLNRRMPVVTTAFAHGPWEKHRVWYEALHGNRGLIIWDDKNELIRKDGMIGDRGREVAPYYNELRSGLGALLIASQRQADPIAIHYSQASMRTEWMLAHRAGGSSWAKRTSSVERKDSEFLRLRESYCRLLEDLGLQYNFVSYAQIERGELLRRGYRVLVLPHSSSLSASEAANIRAFIEQGGKVLTEGMPGTYNEHSRKLDRSPLADLFPDGYKWNADILNYHQNRLVGKEGPVLQDIGQQLRAMNIGPRYTVHADDGKPLTGIETHTFQNGGVTLIALHTNPQLRVDELGPPEFKSNDRFATARALRVDAPAGAHVYDVRSGKPVRELRFQLDPYEPAIFAISPVPLPEVRIMSPVRTHRGATAVIGLSLVAPSPATTHIFRVDAVDPTGKAVSYYSANVRAEGGRASHSIPFAVNDAVGKWEIRVKDVLSGRTAVAQVEVE